jgi:hypothetical protein
MPSIPKDSTLASVWPHLTEPRIYVAGARHKMELCRREYGNAHVRIGIRGSGQKQCYRIFHRSEAASETVYGSYWDNHQPLEIEDAVTANWSRASMDFDEVDAFLRERIGAAKR